MNVYVGDPTSVSPAQISVCIPYQLPISVNGALSTDNFPDSPIYLNLPPNSLVSIPTSIF